MAPLRPCFVRIPGSPGSPTAAVAAGELARGAAADASGWTRARLTVGLATLAALALPQRGAAAEPAQRSTSAALVALSHDPPPRPVPIEAFYDVLRDHGTFIDSDRYGALFCPRPDEVGADFQPYLHGHWIMTEAGWTFTSDLKISWVTDHYGRWVEAGLQNCNLAWLPGGERGPAWVDFRVGEKVIAWRPRLYDGPRVALRRPEAASFPRFTLPTANFSTSDSGFVAVRDGEFLSNRLDYVALTGVQLYSALRETEPLRNVRAGLNSDERDRIVARITERKAAQLAAAGAAKGGVSGPASTGAGAPDAFEPAQRRRKPGTTGGASAGAGSTGVAGSAGSVRTGLPGAEPPKTGKGSEKLGLTGVQPGQTPPDRTNMSTGSSAGSAGQFSGAKVLEWGKPQPPPKLGLPKPAPPDPSSHTLAPEPGPAKKSPSRSDLAP